MRNFEQSFVNLVTRRRETKLPKLKFNFLDHTSFFAQMLQNLEQKVIKVGTVVVVQFEDRSVPTPEVRGSNPVIRNFFLQNSCLLSM